MRTAHVLALFAILSAACAFRMTEEQASVTFQGVDAEVASPLVDLLEITNVDETQEVENLLKKVLKTTTANRATLITDLAKITKIFKKAEKSLLTQISTLKANIAELKTKITKKEAQIKATEKKIKDAEDAISQAQKDIVKENARRIAFHKKQLKIQKDNRAGVAACKDALSYMAKFAAKDLTKSQLIKAKTGTKVFAEMGSTLKSHFERIRETLNEGSIEVTMVETLMEVAALGVNDKLIAKIDAAIKDLEASLTANIAQSIADDAKDLKAHDALIKELKGVIATNEAILKIQRPLLVKYKKELKTLKKSLAHNQSLLKSAQACLANLRKEYKAEKARYEKVIKRLKGDITGLDEAIAYLAEQTYANKATKLNRDKLMKL